MFEIGYFAVAISKKGHNQQNVFFIPAKNESDFDSHHRKSERGRKLFNVETGQQRN